MRNIQIKNQGGISLIEILIATLMASIIFLLVLTTTGRIQKNNLWQESIAYRQSILQNGWYGLIKSVKKLEADHNVCFSYRTYTDASKTTSHTGGNSYCGSSSINNTIVMQSSDFKGNPVLTADLVSSAKTGPSKVDVASDQLVIQYTKSAVGTHDCEGKSIEPYALNQKSVVERYYVREISGSANLELVCDAARYDEVNGFVGMGTAGKTVLPNIDYFKAKIISLELITISATPTKNRNSHFTDIDDFFGLPPVDHGRPIVGVELGAIFHSPIPAGFEWTPEIKSTFSLMGETVTLNGGLDTTDAVYDKISNTVAINVPGGN